MYDEILKGIQTHYKMNDVELNTHLEDLKPYVKNLRTAFRHFPVRFDYKSIPTQEAYMIAYYPHYTLLIEYVLEKYKDYLGEQIPEKLSFFGSGPCPEIIGYLNFLNNNKSYKSLNINIYDIASEHWKFSRDITKHYLIPKYQKNQKVNSLQSYKVDITKKWKFKNTNTPQLIIFQNCLNEIDIINHKTILENIIEIYNNIPENSIIAIIDLHNYREVLGLIQKIQNNLKINNSCSILRDVSEGEINLISKHKRPPQIIKEHLLTGIPYELQNGLIPRSKVKFTFSLIKKGNTPFKNIINNELPL